MSSLLVVFNTFTTLWCKDLSGNDPTLATWFWKVSNLSLSTPPLPDKVNALVLLSSSVVSNLVTVNPEILNYQC